MVRKEDVGMTEGVLVFFKNLVVNLCEGLMCTVVVGLARPAGVTCATG